MVSLLRHTKDVGLHCGQPLQLYGQLVLRWDTQGLEKVQVSTLRTLKEPVH